jgi:hypothetical protein
MHSHTHTHTQTHTHSIKMTLRCFQPDSSVHALAAHPSRQQTTDSKQQTPDTRHQTPDTRHQTPDQNVKKAAEKMDWREGCVNLGCFQPDSSVHALAAHPSRQQTSDIRHQTADSKMKKAEDGIYEAYARGVVLPWDASSQTHQCTRSLPNPAESKQQTADSRQQTANS